MRINLQNIYQYREGNRLEAKQAHNGLPASLWETYSAFANTDGGVILLGVKEKEDHSLDIIGVDDAEKLISDFWNTVNNPQKINVNVLTNQCVQVIEQNGKTVVAIDVPRADRTMKPVFVGTDPMRGSYRRNGEGDYHCNLQVTPHYQVTYNPERTTVRLEIEVLDDPKDVYKDVHKNVRKDVLKDDPKKVAYESIDFHTNSLAAESHDDPKDVHKDVYKDVHKDVYKDVYKDVHKKDIKSTDLTKRQRAILSMMKENGNITLEALAQKFKVSKKTVYRETSQLQKLNKIERVGSNTNGEWKVLE